MKTLIALSLLFTSSVYACAVNDMNIHEIREGGRFTEIGSTSAAFPAYLFSQFNSLGEFDYEACKDGVTEVIVEDTDGSRLRMVYTIEDSCDGGNSYGLILNDKTLAPVAIITDGDVSCI